MTWSSSTDAASLAEVRHVCARVGEEDRVAMGWPFIRRGLALGERCIYIARDPEKAAPLIAGREGADDVILTSWPESRSRGGELDASAMMAWFEAQTDAALAAGYHGLCIASETYADAGTTDALPEWEARLDVMIRERPVTALCMYGHRGHSPACYRTALPVHPHVVVVDCVITNHHWQRVLPSPAERDERELARGLDDIRRIAAGEFRARRPALMHGLRAQMDASERGLRGLARELHDDLGQILTALRMRLQPPEGGDAAALARVIADGNLLVLEALESVRALALDLRPSLLDDLGLAAALRSLVHRQSQRSGAEIDLELEGLDDVAIDDALATTCFRLIEQALVNALHHAGTCRISVAVAVASESVELTVRDEGRGFDVEAVRGNPRRSLGLVGMRERAELEGGTLTITSSLGNGTIVHAALPRRGAA